MSNIFTKTQTAEATPFDSEANEFTSENVQDAIEESLELAKASRFQYLQFQYIGE